MKVRIFVADFALGMALIAPNCSALVSKRRGERQAGAPLGIQNAAKSLGQSVGPLLGGVLFIWQMNALYLLSGTTLMVLALVSLGKLSRSVALPKPMEIFMNHSDPLYTCTW